jgi:hypothetical protein
MQLNLGPHHGKNSYVIKGTLPEQQNTFLSVSRPPLEEFLENSKLEICVVFSNGVSLVPVCQLTTVYLTSDLTSLRYLGFHSKNFPENAHLTTTNTLFKL